MLLRRFAHSGHSSNLSTSVTLGLIALLFLVSANGCRTPWRATSGQPDFDRLIEIERQQSGQSSSLREPLAAQHRPGSASRKPSTSRSASSTADDDRESIEGDEVQLAAAQRSLHERDEIEEMLIEVPPSQRDLLRREMTAMRARSTEASLPDAEHLAQAKTPPANSTRASRRISDDDSSDSPQSVVSSSRSHTADRANDPGESNSGYAGSSKYQMAAVEGRPEVGEVKPRAVEQPYTRNLTDKPQPRPQSSRGEPIVQRAPQTTNETSPVVMASYSETQPSARPPVESTAQEITWREHIHQALAQLDQESDAASPEEQVHRAMVDRLLHLSLSDINAASEPIEGLQTHGQDFIRHSLESLYEVTNPTGNPVEIKRYSLAMLSQRKALSHLASVSNLEVHNATFCTEVDGYGVVSKFSQYAFKPDQELLLYCELDNFVSSQIDGKGFETQLQGSYEIVDSSGRRIADQLLPMDSHLCRNQRRDYFIAYRIYMPQSIEPGKYQLKLTVEDLKGRKFGQANLDFQISR